MDETDVEVGVHLYRDIREFNASRVIPTVVVSHLPMGGRRLRRESTPNNRQGKGCEGRREWNNSFHNGSSRLFIWDSPDQRIPLECTDLRNPQDI